MKYLISLLIMLTFSAQIFADGPTIVDSIEDAIAVAEQTNQKIVVVFGASWCGACRRLDKDLSNNLQIIDNYIYVHIDTDKRSDLKKEYKVKSIPDILILDNNKEIKRRVGYTGISDFKRWIDK